MLSKHHLALRKDRITSSTIYWVVNAPHYAYRLIKNLEPFAGNEATEIGDAFEVPIRNLAARRLDLAARKAPFRAHPRHEWAGDSADCVFFPKNTPPSKVFAELVAIGEIKTAGANVAQTYGEAGTEEVPERVYVQSQWHLAHWPEVETCHAAAFLGGGPLRVKLYPIRRDDEIQRGLLASAERFWRDYLLPGVPPPPDWHDSTTAYLKRLYPSGDGTTVDADDTIIRAASEYVRCRVEKLSAERLQDEQANILRNALGAHSAALGADGKKLVSISDVAGSTYQVTREPYRRLTVSASKGGT